VTHFLVKKICKLNLPYRYSKDSSVAEPFYMDFAPAPGNFTVAALAAPYRAFTLHTTVYGMSTFIKKHKS
jgi:hypothetical protein